MAVKMMCILYTLFISQSNAICNYFYDRNILIAPVQLDTCSYSKQGFSSGYYCRSENYNNSVKTYVMYITFDAADCPDNRGEVIIESICSGVDCHCNGNKDDCTIAKVRIEDFNSNSNMESLECNSTSYEEYYYAWDICVSRGNLGGQYFYCDHNGMFDIWKINNDCSGNITYTSSTIDTNCRKIGCQSNSIRHSSVITFLISFYVCLIATYRY
eukprot:481009_1